MAKAVGLLEVYGLSTAFYAADAACKAANVTIEAIDKNRPVSTEPLAAPLLIMINFRGSVDDVKAAIEAGERAANELTGCLNARIIASPDKRLEKFLQISCL